MADDVDDQWDPKLSPQERAVFDALWQLAGAARLEAVTPAGTRYAVTGDIVRDMALAAVAALERAQP